MVGEQANAEGFFSGAYPLGFNMGLILSFQSVFGTRLCLCGKIRVVHFLQVKEMTGLAPAWMLGASSSEQLSLAHFVDQRLQ